MNMTNAFAAASAALLNVRVVHDLFGVFLLGINSCLRDVFPAEVIKVEVCAIPA